MSYHTDDLSIPRKYILMPYPRNLSKVGPESYRFHIEYCSLNLGSILVIEAGNFIPNTWLYPQACSISTFIQAGKIYPIVRHLPNTITFK